MKLMPDRYPGWTDHPVYTISQLTIKDYDEFYHWCYVHQVETFLLSSGNSRQTFQVKTNHELFVLKWL